MIVLFFYLQHLHYFADYFALYSKRIQLHRDLSNMSQGPDFMLAEDPLSLDRIRSVLTRLEDTIIFSLIERAQFAHNHIIYQRGAFRELKNLGFEGSWLEWFLKETEIFHGESSP